MAHERLDTVGTRFSSPPVLARSRKEALEELALPCGRFLSPLSLRERLSGYVSDELRSFDVFGSRSVIIGSGTPLNWQRLVNYLFSNGIISINRIRTYKFPNDRPKFFNFKLKLDTTSRATDGRSTTISGYGASLSADEAISKTIGETLERYFLSLYSRRSFLRASVRELKARGKGFLDPMNLNGYLKWQQEIFPKTVWNDETPFHWVKGEEFMTGKKSLIPAQLVFWNYRHSGNSSEDKERVIARPTTSGSAGHFTRDEAILSGLLEQIQRDGFCIYWLNKLSPRVLEVPDDLDAQLTSFLAYLRRYRIDITFLNTTTDLRVPSITCVLRDDLSGGPIISVGSAAGFNIVSMLMQSVLEAAAVGGFTATSDAYVLPENYRPFIDPKIQREERLRIWKGPLMAARFAFFTSGKKQNIEECMGSLSSIQTSSEQLSYVCGQLREMGKGYEPYVYEVHDPVLKKLGFHVVRTIVPQLFPLYLRESAATLDSKRLREVPAKLGYAAAIDLNPWPHPFP